ncbi:MAG: TonB-dependent receptor [Bryobacterales bacterium]|nr:TonB-dependent receptor [Bryobacterales bacterium]
MLHRPIGRRVYLLSIAAICVSPLVAQTDRGTISGTVADSSGAVIPGAKITVTNVATNQTTTTYSTDSGDYTAPSLSVGQYTVRVDRDGFKPAMVTNVTVNASTTIREDVTLEIGTSQQVIEVQAQTAALQTEDAKTSTTITNKLVDELPMVVGGALRSPFTLATLTPEAKNFGDNNFALGGGQSASYGTNLDGVSANTTRALTASWVAVNTPSVEAITEFTVETNGFKAEYGHAGGGMMSFASKSGTNELHGNVYEFLRNNALDSNRFFSNALRQSKAIYKQHDFGATAGGPVWIPKIYNGKNKTFFFFSYEGFRNRAGAQATSASVPTSEMYNGDFSKWVNQAGALIPIYDPQTTKSDPSGRFGFTRDMFPGNQIPKSRFDPVAIKALSAFQSQGLVLTPNLPVTPGTSAYVRSNYLINQGVDLAPVNKLSVKGDHIFSEKDRISGYAGINRTYVKPGPQGGQGVLPGLYADYNDTQRHSDVFRMSWDHTFSPTLLNHFYAGGNNWRENHDPPQATVQSGINWKDKVCLAGVPDCDQNILRLSFTEFNTWAGPANNGSENTIYSFNNDLTWIKGKHTFKAGGMFQRNHYNGFGRQCVAGCASFSFKETGYPGDSNFNTAGGNSFASFLLGYVDNGSVDTIRFIGQQWPYFAGFFQDDWKVTPRLTLNLGIRWETTLPPVEQEDRWMDFSPTRPNPGAGGRLGAAIFAGSGEGREGTRTLADTWFKGWGPHIGVAWNVTPKTVIRASYARSFATVTTVTGSTHNQGFSTNPGFSSQDNGVTPAFMLSGSFPAFPKPPFINPSGSNGLAIPWWQGQEATRLPEYNSWNLSIQRQLSNSTVLDFSYNGQAGSHLQTALLNYNQVPTQYLDSLGPAVLNSNISSPAAQAAGIVRPYATFNGSVAQALRPYPQFTGIDTWSGGGDHSGHSTYHAGIVKIEKRYANGISLQSSYVLSKLFTDSDTYWVTDNPRAADHYNRRLEKSIGFYDITHNAKLGVVYDIPFGKGRKWLTSGPGNWVLGGWRFASIHYYASGRPLGITSGIDLPLSPNVGARQAAIITTYDGWRGAVSGANFDPNPAAANGGDRFTQPISFFPAQSNTRVGNSTRANPKLREFPNYNENISLAKTFQIHEKVRVDFRWEAFNVLNRVRFGTGPLSLSNPNFGRLTSNSDLLNTPRTMQFGLKFYY